MAATPSLIGYDTSTNQQIFLDCDDRQLGVTVLGRTGYGKSTLLEHLILSDIRNGTSCVVIDAHGDLINDVITHAPAGDRYRMHLVEVWEDCPFRLNLFTVPDPEKRGAADRTADGVVQVFKKLFNNPNSYAPRLERDLGHAARTVIANNGTLLDVTRLFWDTDFRNRYLQNVTNVKVLEYWENFDRIARVDRQQEQLESTVNRLDTFLASELSQQIFDSTETTIPLEAVLNEPGHALLVRIPVGEIGDKLCDYLGSLLLCVLANNIYARANISPELRNRVHLYLDEYGRFCNPVTAGLLTEGRKYNLGTTIAHQTRAQIPDEENKAAELQVGTLVCLRLIPEDAAELSGSFPVQPEPQWEERLEEIEGTEPVLSVTRRPIEHLIRHSVSPAVDEAVHTVIVPLDREKYKVQTDKQPRYIRTAFGSSAAQVYTDAFAQINDFLVDCMAKKFEGNWKPAADRLAEIFITYPLIWQFDEHMPNDLPEGSTAEAHEYIKKIVLCVAERERRWTGSFMLNPSSTDHPEELPITSTSRLRLFFGERLGSSNGLRSLLQDDTDEQNYAAKFRDFLIERECRGAYKEFRSPMEENPYTSGWRRGLGGRSEYRVWGYRPNESLAEARKDVTYEQFKAMEWDANDWWGPKCLAEINEALTLLLQYAGALFALGRHLAKEPILINSGLMQPATRVRYIVHPQRSYQDVRNELAQDLVKLPSYTALIQTPQGPHRIDLLAPATDIEIEASPLGVMLSPVEQVRRRSKQLYGRPWNDGGDGRDRSLPPGPDIRPSVSGNHGSALPEPDPSTQLPNAPTLPPPLQPLRSRKPPRKTDRDQEPPAADTG